MSEGADEPGGEFGQSPRTRVGSAAGSAPLGSAEPDHLFSGRPPSPGWTPPARPVPPQRPSRAGSEPADGWLTLGVEDGPEPPPGDTGTIDIEAWLKLTGADEPPPRPTWTLATGQFPVVSTGQLPIVVDRGGPARNARFDALMEAGHRWRTPLGLIVAALLTVTVVLTVRQTRNGQLPDDTQLQAAGAQARQAEGGSALLTNQATLPTESPGGRGSDGSTGGSAPGAAADGQPPGDPAATSPQGSGSPAAGSQPDPASPTTVTGTPLGTSGVPSVTPTTLAGSAVPSNPPASVAPPSPGGVTREPGGSPAKARPEQQRLQAEQGRLLGQAAVRSDQPGFTGTAYVADILAPGSGVEWDVTSPAAGQVTIRVRYSAGNDVAASSRTLTVRVNGVNSQSLRMPRTGSWDQWREAVVTISLNQGVNTLALVMGPGDTGFLYLDAIGFD